MLRRLIWPAASAVSGATRIALGHTHAPTVRGPSGSAVGPLAPQQFSLAHRGAGGRCAAPCAHSHSVFFPPPHPLPHFVQALSAAAFTSRFGLQPPSAAVAPLPARLSVRLRRARRLGTWWRCVAAARSALRRLDLTLVSYAASFPLAPSLVCRPASTLRPPSCILLMV